MKHSRNLRRIFAAALVASVTQLSATAQAENSWPSFQNAGKSVIAEAAIPVEWSAEKNVAWQTPIEGYGQSTPVVSGDQIVITSTSGDQKEKYHVVAYALTTGQKIWQRDFDNPSPAENNAFNSRAASSPVADSNGYVTLFAGGLLAAVGNDGNVRWERNLFTEFGQIEANNGLGASLEQDDENVFVWIERKSDPYLMAVKKSTGETVWKVEGLGGASWATPRLVPTADGNHLVCSANGSLVGFDPSTGNKLWEFTDIEGNNSCTPAPLGDGKFLIGSGTVSSNGVIQIAKQADGTFSAAYVWQAKKASSNFGSPIAAGGKACFVNRGGVLFLLDLVTGEEVTTARIGVGGLDATPLAVGNNLYVFGTKGETAVVSLTDGKQLAKNTLWTATGGGGGPGNFGPALYAAAAVPPYLILRRGDILYAVKTP